MTGVYKVLIAKFVSSKLIQSSLIKIMYSPSTKEH